MSETLKNILLKNKSIIMDIDGVLLSDSADEVSLEVVAEIARLKENNQIYLLTNNHDKTRASRIASQLEVKLIETRHLKPSIKTLKGLQLKKAPVVIGDKWITDGILARRINAQFYKVKRLKSKDDIWYTKLAYLFDDLIWQIFKNK